MSEAEARPYNSAWGEPVPIRYDRRDVLLYAVGIGTQHLGFVFEGDPQFAVFPTFPIRWGGAGAPVDTNAIPHSPGPLNIDAERYLEAFVGGWYLSGDLAEKDEEGYFWFVGRADDVIKSSGHLIGPFEVESILIEHEAVAELGEVGGERRVPLRLTRFEANVLEQHDRPCLGPCDRGLGDRTPTCRNHRGCDLGQQIGQSVCDRIEAEARLGTVLRPSPMPSLGCSNGTRMTRQPSALRYGFVRSQTNPAWMSSTKVIAECLVINHAVPPGIV